MILVIQALYSNSNSAVVLNNQLGELFITTAVVRQGRPLSSVLFNIFIENTMQESLQDFNTSISIGGSPVCILRFANDINLMGGSENELQDLTIRLEEKARAYGMEVSSEKSKVLVTLITTITNCQNLEEVDSFKYLGTTLLKDGTSTKEIKIRIAVAMSTTSRLNTVWKSRDISFKTRLKLCRTLAVSILLYACESWYI